MEDNVPYRNYLVGYRVPDGKDIGGGVSNQKAYTATQFIPVLYVLSLVDQKEGKGDANANNNSSCDACQMDSYAFAGYWYVC
jgi:hypothetical protein